MALTPPKAMQPGSISGPATSPVKGVANDSDIDQLIADNVRKRNAAAAKKKKKVPVAPVLTPDLTNTQAGLDWLNMDSYGNSGSSTGSSMGGSTGGGGSPVSTSGADIRPTQDKLSATDLAEKYGFASAVLRSNKEISRLFDQAIAGQWSAANFIAKFRSTKYYKNHGEKWRTTEALRLTDPKTYQTEWNAAKAEVSTTASALGATLSESTLTNVVNAYYRQGYNPQQLNTLLSRYIFVKDGVLGGQAGKNVQDLKELARANGVQYNGDWFNNASRAVIAGKSTMQDYENAIREQAASAFPVYAEQIKAGQNVADIASPYVQRMSALLEINSNDIDLFDNSIKQALSGRNPETGKAETKSLWQFENDLRKDPRWQYTNNAREATSSITNGILKRWGLSG